MHGADRRRRVQRQLHRQRHRLSGTTYTDPGPGWTPPTPDDAAFVNALLANQASFNWITHTWSHQFLGCNVWAAQPLTSVTANGSGGTLAAGSYNYEVTAATAYGESEPSTAQPVTVAANGSVTLTWPEATNGTGDGRHTPGRHWPRSRPPTPAAPASGATTSTARTRAPPPTAWSARWPRTRPATSSSTYSFTDTGDHPGCGAGVERQLPHRHQPRHRLRQRRRAGSRPPATGRRQHRARRSAWTRPSPRPTG